MQETQRIGKMYGNKCSCRLNGKRIIAFVCMCMCMRTHANRQIIRICVIIYLCDCGRGCWLCFHACFNKLYTPVNIFPFLSFRLWQISVTAYKSQKGPILLVWRAYVVVVFDTYVYICTGNATFRFVLMTSNLLCNLGICAIIKILHLKCLHS